MYTLYESCNWINWPVFIRKWESVRVIKMSINPHKLFWCHSNHGGCKGALCVRWNNQMQTNAENIGLSAQKTKHLWECMYWKQNRKVSLWSNCNALRFENEDRARIHLLHFLITCIWKSVYVFSWNCDIFLAKLKTPQIPCHIYIRFYETTMFVLLGHKLFCFSIFQRREARCVTHYSH